MCFVIAHWGRTQSVPALCQDSIGFVVYPRAIGIGLAPHDYITDIVLVLVCTGIAVYSFVLLCCCVLLYCVGVVLAVCSTARPPGHTFGRFVSVHVPII